MKKEALYPFGIWVKYKIIEITDASMENEKLTEGEKITLDVSFMNQGSMPGAETIQIILAPEVLNVRSIS